jgi:uncharacterized membrane protein HdeD (DUF308 family)
MTDPRMDPADSPGQEGGAGPPGSSGQQQGGQQTRHGLFHRGSPAKDTGSTSTSGTSAGSTATVTRQTTTTGTSVPQQAGQASPTRPQYGQEQYGRAEYGQDYERAGAAAPGGKLIAKAASTSWMLLLLGALGMIAVGVSLLVWPHASLTVVAILIGAALVISGLVRLWEGFTTHDQSGGMRAGYVVIGLLAVLAGIYCLRHHALSIFLVAFVAGVYFIAHGIADLGVAFSADVPGRGLRAVLGIFSIAAGLILVIWPSLTLVLLLTITGAWLLFYGCVLGALAFGVRKSAKAMTAEQSPTTTTTAAARAA